MEIARTLESRGKTGKVILIDGSPLFFQKYAENIIKSYATEELGQIEMLSTLIRIDFPQGNEEILKSVLVAADWDSKLDVFMKFHESNKNSTKQYSRHFITAILRRLKMMGVTESSQFSQVKISNISLVKPTDKFLTADIGEFYGLESYSSSEIEVVTIDGNHISVLESQELFNFINRINE